jgi:hypothetical protein
MFILSLHCGRERKAPRVFPIWAAQEWLEWPSDYGQDKLVVDPTDCCAWADQACIDYKHRVKQPIAIH